MNFFHLLLPVVQVDELADFWDVHPLLGGPLEPAAGAQSDRILAVAVSGTGSPAGAPAGAAFRQKIYFRHLRIRRIGPGRAVLLVLLLLQLLVLQHLLVLALALGHGLHAGAGAGVHHLFLVPEIHFIDAVHAVC